MRTYRAAKGPLKERPYYSLKEIEDICADELRKVDLYPKTPEPIRIERFIEKRFGIHPEYAELPEGLLGYTKFGPRGAEEIVVSRVLSEERSKVAERQVNSTLAHEAGHGLLQAHLFVLEQERLTSLFGDGVDPHVPKILCREHSAAKGKGYDGRWWEFQANQAIGALLLPKPLVLKVLAEFTTPTGALGVTQLDSSKRQEATRKIVEIFDVNPPVARIRLSELYPEDKSKQLML